MTAATERCDDPSHVSFVQGGITDLPVANETYDLVIAKQVLSAVSDIDPVLSELFRVIKPGGRVAVTSGSGGGLVMHTPTARMQRANEIYNSEIGDRRLGTRLVALLPEAGFAIEDITPHTKIKTDIDDQIENGIEVQRGLLEASDTFDESEIDAWEQDLRGLEENGRFFSCSMAFLYIARKPE